MGTFIIGDTDFGVGNVTFSTSNDSPISFSLRIKGSDDVYKQIFEDENGEWSWTLYPPEIYFEGIPFAQSDIIAVDVNDDLLDTCDIALYLMEHNDLIGKLIITDKYFKFNGESDIFGKIYQVEIFAERTE